MTADAKQLWQRLVGRWTTEATHPAMPGVVVRGTADFEWLEGERFLIQRSRNDHPDFPDAIWIIGHTDSDRVSGSASSVPAGGEQPMHLHYYDSRGVFRDCETSIDEAAWRYERMAPGFSQRFTGTFSKDGETLDGICQLCRDDRTWHDDLKILYRRSR